MTVELIQLVSKFIVSIISVFWNSVQRSQLNFLSQWVKFYDCWIQLPIFIVIKFCLSNFCATVPIFFFILYLRFPGGLQLLRWQCRQVTVFICSLASNVSIYWPIIVSSVLYFIETQNPYPTVISTRGVSITFINYS